MQDASTPRKRVLRVNRDFETSRLEKGLLATAYERAVPIISRRPSETAERISSTPARPHRRPKRIFNFHMPWKGAPDEGQS